METSSQESAPEKNSGAAANDQQRPEHKSEPINWNKEFKEWSSVVINLILVGITYFIYTLAVDQTEISKQSIQLAKEQFRISNRPYFVTAKIDRINITAGKKFETTVYLKNAGNSPAFRVKTIAQIETMFVDFPDIPQYGKVSTPQSLTIIGQGDTLKIKVSTDSLANSYDVSAIINKESRLYIHGFVEYEDFFKDRHTTTFCSVYRVSGGDFVFCDKYNEDK